MNNKIKIILDCDPGYDDAVAITLAGFSEKIDLLGIVAVAGNQSLEKTSRNALNLVNYLKLKVPVYKGLSLPILKDYKPSPKVHGETGLDGMEFEKENPLHFEEKSGIDFIIETCLKNEKITIVTTGPMTDIGIAFRLNPDIKKHVEQIVMMGGSMGKGNVSPSAEFNIYDDPDAAYIVFTSGVKIVMAGLDVTTQTIVNKEILERMSKLNTKSSKLFCTCMENYNLNRYEAFGESEYGPVHDPVTIAYLIDNSLLKLEHMYVEIDRNMGPCIGRTNCFSCKKNKELKPNTFVAQEINIQKFWDIVESILKIF